MLTLQKLTVEQVCDLDLNAAFIVGPNKEFSRVIQRFADYSELRGIFVADDEGRLLGVITRTDLLDWARARLGAIFQKSRQDQDKTIRLLNLMRASTAGQVMHPNSHRAGAKLKASLSHALQLMIELDLIVLPVIDDSNRIVGDLKLSKLLATPVEASEQ